MIPLEVTNTLHSSITYDADLEYFLLIIHYFHHL